MTMKNKTRRALVLSVLSLILCCSMLVGTTFAWFTDSVTSGNNVIQSGNLDISMQHARWNGLGYDAWEEVANSTGLFLNQEGKSILWEPEAEAQERFKIVNEGSLALKYQLKLGYTNATVAPNGKTLADVLEVTSAAWGNTDAVKEGETKVALLKDYVFEAYLLPGESQEFEVIIKWNQSANDNDYNIAGGMKIDMGVYLLATQHTYEVDVEDDQYDKNATYDASVIPDVVLQAGENKTANTQALKDAIAAGDADGDGKVTVELAAGEYSMPAVKDKEVTIKGTTATKIDVTKEHNAISDATFVGVTITGNDKGQYNGFTHTDEVVYENCVIDGTLTLYGASETFKNCTFNLPAGCYIWTWGAKNVVFDGCTFNTYGKAILMYGENQTTNMTVANCTFNATEGAKASAIANQNCAAIEIDNSGKGVGTNTSSLYTLNAYGNTVDSDFSGTWRIKTIDTAKKITVNGKAYDTLALDGKTMTIDASKNVTVN